MTETSRISAAAVASAILTVLALYACQRGNDDARRAECEALRSGVYDLHMWSGDSSYSVEGAVKLEGRTGMVSVVAVSHEGTGEPITTQIDSLRLINDSVSFRFAPIGFRLRGRCEGKDAAEGQFSVPQPPFAPITGEWTLRRRSD